VRLPEELEELLKQKAAGGSVNALIVEALRRFLDEETWLVRSPVPARVDRMPSQPPVPMAGYVSPDVGNDVSAHLDAVGPSADSELGKVSQPVVTVADAEDWLAKRLGPPPQRSLGDPKVKKTRRRAA
jgi:hypothetical protein